MTTTSFEWDINRLYRTRFGSKVKITKYEKFRLDGSYHMFPVVGWVIFGDGPDDSIHETWTENGTVYTDETHRDDIVGYWED